MKSFIAFSFGIIFLSCSATSQQESSFDWLMGTWVRQGLASGKAGFENWSRVTPGTYVGQGISLVNGDTTFVENLAIKKIDNVWYYIADVPENPAPVKFAIDEYDNHHFMAANEAHDFPKKITYQYIGGSLEVEVSGGDRRIVFVFKKGP